MPRLPIESCTSTSVTLNGRELVAFGGCNYLGLADRPSVRQALIDGLDRWGFSTTASRETTGNTLAHEALERELASFVGQESAILTAEGYTANFACMQGLARDIGIALIDQRAHRSIRDAAIAAGMQVFEFEHLSASSAQWLIKLHRDAGVAIMTDSVFAADGSIAPLAELLELLPAQRSALVVDDCHGFGVLGPNGQGAVSHFQIDDPRVAITTTLAKGMGCYGGAILGRSDFVKKVRDRAWVYRNSTPVPPAIAEAVRESIRIVSTDAGVVQRLRENVRKVRDTMTSLGFALPPEQVPIFTFHLESEKQMESVYARLLDFGLLIPLIDYPGGPAPRYFRLVVTAAHTPEDLDILKRGLNTCLARLAVTA